MRRIFRPLVMFLAMGALVASCLGDDDLSNITYYSDTAITSFSVGTLNRTMTTTASDGTDSTYTDEVDGSEYDFYIDQLARQVYNPDSLPVRTDVAHVLCSASTKNGGVAIWAYKDEEGEDSLVYFSSTDSIDFTEARELRVYSNNGLEYRSYTVKVNVHTEDPDSINWQVMGTYAPFASLEAMKAFVVDGTGLLVLGKSGSETVVYTYSGSSWAEAARLDGDACGSSVVRGDSVYAMTADGVVARSHDGATWETETVAGSVSPVRLLAAGKGRLYGVADDGLVVSSAQSGYGWSVDGQPSDISGLPVADVNSASLAVVTNSETERVVLVGNRDRSVHPEDTVAMVWNKIEEYADNSETHSWMSCNDNNGLELPNMEGLSMAACGDVLLAIGGTGSGDSAQEAYSCIYVSEDNGLTWHADDGFYLPSDFDNGSSSVAAMAVDDDNFIWIVCGGTGQVWRGRLNSMGWDDVQTSFTE